MARMTCSDIVDNPQIDIIVFFGKIPAGKETRGTTDAGSFAG
jgi:hypothetical protein